MSLNQRTILSATLVLLIFITLTAVALERAFVDSSESALRDKLTSQLYALMAAAEVSDDGIVMPTDELDALLGLPSSGVYALIVNPEGQVLWQSSSVLGEQLPVATILRSGEQQFQKSHAFENDFYIFSYGVNWSTESSAVALTFNIVSDLDSFDKQIKQYRTTLWGWLLAMAILLIVSQAVILRWGLLPLRKVGLELNRIEAGEQEQIEKDYPQEIDHLTRNINVLLRQERDQKTRYRNALGDLAHSLKTPLAILQSGLDNADKQPDDSLQEQILRMNSIVEYQLQRAATAGSASIGKTVDVATVTQRILDSLQKVYRDKAIKTEVMIDEGLRFRGDEGDLMELLGNLLDNAFKWSKKHIAIVIRQQQEKLCILISDDGAGIEPEQIEVMLQRGVRADQVTPGHGIGLSIVSNIVDAYQGELTINKNQPAGTEVRVLL